MRLISAGASPTYSFISNLTKGVAFNFICAVQRKKWEHIAFCSPQQHVFFQLPPKNLSSSTSKTPLQNSTVPSQASPTSFLRQLQQHCVIALDTTKTCIGCVCLCVVGVGEQRSNLPSFYAFASVRNTPRATSFHQIFLIWQYIFVLNSERIYLQENLASALCLVTHICKSTTVSTGAYHGDTQFMPHM